MMTDLAADYERLRAVIAGYGPCVTAFSGGVDSSLVALVSAKVHGAAALAVTGVSPSLSASERKGATNLARDLGLRHRLVETHELESPGYRANAGDRCYFCKHELFRLLADVAEGEGLKVVTCGDNLDDLSDHRPGMRAAAEFQVRSPLIEAKLGKAKIRALARELGLSNHNKLASPCLASRVPVGRPVDRATLMRIEAAEAALRALGLTEFRVRDHGDLARIEVPARAMPNLVERRVEIVAALSEVGYRYVSCDLRGFRGASLPVLAP